MGSSDTEPVARQRTCLDCGCVNTRTSWRCAPCFAAHKKRKHKEYLERAAQRAVEEAERRRIWEAERPQREAAERAQRAKEAAAQEAVKAAALLKERSPEGRAARKAAVDAALATDGPRLKRGPEGTHSWAIVKVRDLENGELYPVRWRCRDCATIKTLEHSLVRPEYEFPQGHERHFPEGLPRRYTAGHCPYGVPAAPSDRYFRWDKP